MAMEEMTAAATGSRVGWDPSAAGRPFFDGEMAFFARFWRARLDFLVPKASPRAVRAERSCAVVQLYSLDRKSRTTSISTPLTLAAFASCSNSVGEKRGLPRRTSFRARMSCKSPDRGSYTPM